MSAMASKATGVWLRDELRVHDIALVAAAARRGASGARAQPTQPALASI